MSDRKRFIPELYSDKKDCCGCGACYNVCPQHTIEMREDEYGFIYPHVNADKCVGCMLCKKVCGYQSTEELRQPIDGYAATDCNEGELLRSASGGAFASMAKYVLSLGGIVFGAAYEKTQVGLAVKHIAIESETELWRLQGSKYVQSATEECFGKVKDALGSGRTVLFSGTPCQVGALQKFLKKEYTNLYTIDIVCHGVPNQRMFRDYLSSVDGNIQTFDFRDKKKGWQDFYIKYTTNRKTKHIHCRVSSFYELFLQGKIYRENCYTCKYACSARGSDITIGDYWGIEKAHPDLMKDDKWKRRLYDGISCVLVNTDKGKKLLQSVRDIDMVVSDVNKITENNGQLREPTRRPEDREEIMEKYRAGGYAAVEQQFKAQLGFKRYILDLKSRIPIGLKKRVKAVLE